ncbi:MAG: hypothetical protein WA210_03130 [Burkholderiaceae bacterium]
MKYDEFNEGEYRIFAFAVPGPQREGYCAAVIVKRLKAGQGEAPIAYREDCMAGGKTWPSPATARRFAAAMARDVIRHEPHRLAC